MLLVQFLQAKANPPFPSVAVVRCGPPSRASTTTTPGNRPPVTSVTLPDTRPALPCANAMLLPSQRMPATSEITPAAADVQANATGRGPSRASGSPAAPDNAAMPMVEPIPKRNMNTIAHRDSARSSIIRAILANRLPPAVSGRRTLAVADSSHQNLNRKESCSVLGSPTAVTCPNAATGLPDMRRIRRSCCASMRCAGWSG